MGYLSQCKSSQICIFKTAYDCCSQNLKITLLGNIFLSAISFFKLRSAKVAQ